MADPATAIDTGAIIMEAVRTAGPVGVIALAAIWWRKQPAKPAGHDDKVVQLLTEIRDLMRDAGHERRAMREDHKRIERRLDAAGLTPVHGLPAVEVP